MKASTRVDYQARVDRVRGYLAEHLDDDVRPPQMAKVAAMSVHHFHRVFKGITGESLMGYRRRLRLERAAKVLRHGTASVTDVAFEAGYGSHEAFTRAFAEQFGVAPVVWRRGRGERYQRAIQQARPLPVVELRNVEARPYLFAPQVGPLTASGENWARFIGELIRHGIGLDDLVGRYPDDPDITPADRIRYDVGRVAPMGMTRAPDGLQLGTLSGGRWAVTTHIGPYDQLADVYVDLVGRWFPSQGLPLAHRACIEVYGNSVMDTAPEDLITEVWAPVGTPL